jgi:hypothetical protein
LVRTLYGVLVGAGWVSPSEFWRLSPGEVWWIIDARTPREVKEKSEGMAELRQMLKDARSRDNG